MIHIYFRWRFKMYSEEHGNKKTITATAKVQTGYCPDTTSGKKSEHCVCLSCSTIADSSYDMMDDTEIDGMATPSGSSSIGDAVSGRGQSASNEEEDVYYIPERRPSLDLGPSPMDTSHWHSVEQASPPALSYWSMTSEELSNSMDGEDGSSTRVQLSRADSFSSCYSLDSDDCEKKIPKVKSKDDIVSEPSERPELIQDPNQIRHPSLTVGFTFKAICDTLGKLSKGDIRTFKMLLWKRYPQSFNTPPQGMDLVDLVDRLLECYNLEVSLQITKTLLEDIGQKKMVDFLNTLCLRNEVRHDVCEILRRTYTDVCGDFAMQEEKRAFDDVFTDLYITSTCDVGPNIEHEVMTIEKLDSNQDDGKALSTKDILCAKRMEHSTMRLMLITGVAGSGKSMLLRRLILDWIEGKSHQHVSFLFPLPFRELKKFEGSEISLLEILQTLYPPTKNLRDEDFKSDDCKLMFLFDGLDEYDEDLDFRNTGPLSYFTDTGTLNVLIVNILRGRLFYRDLYVITSRPQVKRIIPWDTHYDEIDVRGFRDSEKDGYFQKRFKDADQAARVIKYINSIKTLRIMCHLPLFCSLVAAECQHIFRKQGPQAALPRSITYMYTKLLLALTRQHRTIRAPERSPDKERDFLMKLGKLAFNMLKQGQFKITRYDWKEHGIDDLEAVTYSGLCTQYITKPMVLHQEKVLSFIHPTMQEYLAALYVFLSFRNHGKNIFDQQLKQKFKGLLKGHKTMELYKSAMDRSLLCEDGRLDIFLRFLFGMAVTTNQELLQPFFTSSVKWPAAIEDAVTLIRKKIKENQYPGRKSSLEHCLEELGV
ncbi:NLR family CARD domain-containing protein 3 isoform X1 [Dicentrarchus labrax]|uniref:NLR family CARD domain-containing protein 3 isoform X1 n=2 Tax=Dicentrarchus labrax TaxID=13489 RepID=UPI0021F60C4A|nr:NLR family CARD domain-containing protein 3 isoform X1 [Dicentrarchus labrax]